MEPQLRAMSQSDKSTSGLSTNLDTEVGKLVLDMGLASTNEVDYCREQQKQASDPNQRSLADLLVENSFITVNQAKRIRSQLEDRRQKTIPGYDVICLVGKGAMAKVYKARQQSLDRIVAVKVLPKKSGENPEFVERFYKEGRAAARLSHNNIVQAIDVGGTPDGLHYFVMEYVEGKTLYDMMIPPPAGDGHVFGEAETLDIIIQIADALAHSHARGLIHRDVKPKNIILTPSGVAKLTDLGLARAQDDNEAAQSEAGKAYGTPYYISPEQIRGDLDIDFRADIYSLGATMYHLVTGRPPFEADSPSAVMHKHLRTPLKPPDHVNPELSAGISEIIEVAMAKNRDERYASTEDMLEDLRAVRRGEQPTHAKRVANLDTLAQLEEKGKTVDIVPSGSNTARLVNIWSQPVVMMLLGVIAFLFIAWIVTIFVAISSK
jgi:serine/threonine-protein kinase